MKNASLTYLTELNNFSKTRSCSQKVITKHTSLKDTKLKEFIEKSEDQFITYMINKESKFTNLENIEEKKTLQNDFKNKKINENNHEINRKLKYIAKLDLRINHSVKNSIHLNNSDIVNSYEAFISEMNKKMYK